MPSQPTETPLQVETRTIDPRELKLLERNARHMNARQFGTLTDNIRRDGVLTSAPLVAEVDGELIVLSGNHRTKAAIAAGLTSIPILIVSGDLSDGRRVALQLAHNAIVGEDDANLLRELYESLDVLNQRYSGLTDQSFGVLEDLDLSKFTLGQPDYQQVTLMFLPEDREIFIDAMEKLGKGAAKARRYIGRLADFEQFEKAIVAVQDTLDIHNQALALSAMAELALERIAQMEDANGDGNAGEPPATEQMEETTADAK